MNFKSSTAANYAAIAVSIVTIGLMSSHPPFDGDIWWQMVYGKYMIENLTLIPDHSVFSWTIAETAMIYCAWLAEILLYSIHSIAGLPGLFALRYLAMLLPMLFLYWAGKKNRATTTPVVWLGYLVCYLAACSNGGLIKPEMLSFLLFSLIVAIYFRLKTEPNNWKLCYLFPVVMLVWVNTHGAFLVGMGFLSIAVFGELANYLFRSSAALPKAVFKHIAIAAGLTILAICFTPYGIDYPIQLVELNVTRNYQHLGSILAYQNIFSTSVAGSFLPLYLCIALLLTVPLFIEQIARRELDFAVLLVSMTFIAFYISVGRMAYFYITIMAFSLPYLLARSPAWQSVLSKQVKNVNILSWAIVLVMISLSAHRVQDRYRFLTYAPQFGFGTSYLNPKTESEFIEENLSSHKICNGYDSGGYLMWQLWPNQKVMIDPRYFPYKSWYTEYLDLIKTVNDFEKLANFDCNLWSINHKQRSLVATLRTSPDWKLVFVGGSSAVFVKKNSIQGDWKTRVGDDFLQIRDPSQAIEALRLLINNQDFALALELSENMTQRFRGTRDELAIVKTDDYTHGVIAYLRRDYETAYSLISKSQIKRAPINNAAIHLNANQFLVHKLMNEGKYKDALKVALEGVTIAPNNLFALFNAGSLSLVFSEPKPGPQKWQEYFKKYLSLSKETTNSSSADVTAIAESALAGRKMSSIKLLMPIGRPEVFDETVLF